MNLCVVLSLFVVPIAMASNNCLSCICILIVITFHDFINCALFYDCVVKSKKLCFGVKRLKAYFMGVCISQSQVEMRYYLCGASLITRGVYKTE